MRIGRRRKPREETWQVLLYLKLLLLLCFLRSLAGPVEELQSKGQIRLLDDDRFGPDVRQLPIGEVLARLEVK